jgi:hypothetical protein
LTTSGATYGYSQGSSIYLSPASQSFTQGSNIAVYIYEDSGSEGVNAVQANLNYTNNLTFKSINAQSSAFNVQAENSGGGGSVKIARGTATPVTGTKLVAIVNFTASSGGNAVITFASGTAVVRASDNTALALDNMTGASYSISTSSNPNPPPPPPPPTTKPNPKPAPKLSTNNPKTNQANPNNPPPANDPVEPPVTTSLDMDKPIISDIKVTNLSTKSATITWRTSEPTTSEVSYGLSTKYVLSSVDTKYSKEHSVTINPEDLVARTIYHFRIKSIDVAGNVAVSKDLTFKTETPKKFASGNFWAAFAVCLLIGGAALAGASYIRRMHNRVPPTDSGGSMIGPSGTSSETIVTGSASGVDNTPMKSSDEVTTIRPTKKP